MAVEQAKWYVIHTYSGYEMMVKDSLLKLIENNNLQEKVLDVKIPMSETLEEKANGKKKIVQRKDYPCYVFLKMVYSNELWYLITNTRGVTGFVGPQGRPLPLTDDEVSRNQLEAPTASSLNIAVGDEVQIVSGPLESFGGKVVSINEQASKLMVNVTMFGRKTDVEVDFINIKKVTATAENN